MSTHTDYGPRHEDAGRDTARLDWLDSLIGRHVMHRCHKGKNNAEGMRRWDMGTDCHVGGDGVSIYVRGDVGQNCERAGHGANWREAIDAAMQDREAVQAKREKN